MEKGGDVKGRGMEQERGWARCIVFIVSSSHGGGLVTQGCTGRAGGGLIAWGFLSGRGVLIGWG
jgi:hypothetical protein